MTIQKLTLHSQLAMAALGSLFASGCCSTSDCCQTTSCDTGYCSTGCPTECSSGSRTGFPWLVWPSCLSSTGSRMPIPDILPLGAVTRAHWHMQETNGEAADFVMYRNEFVDNSSELTPYGRDHIAEIAARMPSTPFPVLVQRSFNNADPELDQIRRDLVVRVLTDLGNQDADQRTVVSQPYSNGINSMEGEQDYGRFRNIRGINGRNGGGVGGGGGGIGGGF